MADQLYGKCNVAFVREDFTSAINFYSQAIEIDSSQSDYYTNRASCYLKLNNYENVKFDVNKAIELGDNKFSKLWLWKGIASFHLEEYESAEIAFCKGRKLETESTDVFDKWLEQCNVKLEDKMEKEVKLAALKPVTIKYDWYQTEQNVVLRILVRNSKRDEVFIDITNKSLQCRVEGNDKRLDFELNVQLAHEINSEFSSWKIFGSKIEIKLRKIEGFHWNTLEETRKQQVKHFVPALSNSKTGKDYPTSSSHKKDWNKLVSDLKKEDEDEIDGNEVFQKIFADASEEQKKAMVKSFSESGGTVLSTDWEDVRKKKTEIHPPDGLEWRKWDK